MVIMPQILWKKCSTCKEDILTGQKYYVCSVSTCQAKATNYVFCSVNCWDAHVPTERHRLGSAGALERVAPKDSILTKAPSLSPEAPIQKQLQMQPIPTPSREAEILVVVSKVRKYISDRSGMNTSAEAYEVLTSKVKKLCELAIDNARAQGRKTVMARDF